MKSPVFSNIFHALAARRQRHAIRRDLHDMPDSLLRDIGTTRGEIAHMISRGEL